MTSEDAATDHESLIRAAIERARIAEAEGDVPIGAVIARDGQVIAAAHNRRIGWPGSTG
ncbi:MAG: hypothetical protein ACYS5V_09355 [Planctomycetota bacterium]|jgi:tRNA(adenine34) deaminase